MFNPTPTVKGKSNAYLTVSPVPQRDEIEILMHFRVFSPLNREADRHGGCHIYSMNTHGLMHSTILPSPTSPEQNMLLNIKERQRTKLFLKPSIKLLPFMAKSKGHASPPASERGNYPLPVREQQMIANYGGAFSGAEICQ